jgi:hypothetical protein
MYTIEHYSVDCCVIFGLLLQIFLFPLIEQHAISATAVKQVVLEMRNAVVSLHLEERNTE